MLPVDIHALKALCRVAPRTLGVIAAVAVLGAASILTPSPAALASEVRVPITIDYLTLGAALKAQMYTAPGGQAILWNGANDCQFLEVHNPIFSPAIPELRLETDGSLGLGVRIGGRCVSPISWNGIASARTAPYIAPELKLKLRITDLDLYNPEHQKTLIAGQGFDLIKRYLIPQLETFTYDFSPAIQQLGALAEEASTPIVAGRIRDAIATVRAEPQVEVLPGGLRVTMIITVPEFPPPVATGTPASPTPAQIAAFQEQLNQWDAFLVFAIKQLGASVGDKQFRQQLLDILLDSRYRLVAAMSQPPSASGPDPVRILFLETWQRLGDAVHQAAARGQLGSRALQFLSFISAGDALFALDQAAPALGMRVSADDLRRLARIMAPGTVGDPLNFTFGEDEELKRMFNVPEPLSSPPEAASGASAAAASATASSSSATASPTAAPSPSPNPASATRPNPTAAMMPTAPKPPPIAHPAGAAPSARLEISHRLLSLILWPLEPEPANADTGMAPSLIKVAETLRRVVVDSANASRYRDSMNQLLQLSAAREMQQADLPSAYQPTFKLLVSSAAWQESCWRQFVDKGTRVVWLESSTGDIGLMQVNKHVWRGFYSLEKLRWDVLYNAGAGTQILMKMMRSAAAKTRARSAPIDSTSVARSAYAAYNGGPDAYNRWRRPSHEGATARAIDKSFAEKLHAVESGDQIDILTCARDWGHLH